MKTKKNAGFSLVELIVVIAIMAVLVGVLAPAYLKYVEKSRKSADISGVSDIITSASTVAADVEYEVAAGDTFNLSAATGTITMTVTTSDTKAQAGWFDVANCSSGTYTLKSKEFKATSGTATGTVQANGSVVWANPTSGTFKDMCDYSKDFKSKFSS